MNFKPIISLLFLALPSISYSQISTNRSADKKPVWLRGSSAIESSDFMYFVGEGSGSTVDVARKSAIQNVILQYAESLGTSYIVGSETEMDISETKIGDEYHRIEDYQFSAKVKGEEQRFTIPCLSVVEYYWERSSYGGSGYQFWVLVRIPHSKRDCNKPFYKSYGGSAFFRSAILPGWGQLYKNEKTKGYVIMAGTLTLASVSLVSYTQYTANYSYAKQTQNYDMMTQYINTGDNWATISTVTGIAAGALYIYNLIDAIAAKGEKRYASDKPNIKLSPTIWEKGLAFSLTIPIK
ncbi:MAG TPA: DUF5683 domain-containing protein [Salinivirgaceae bacterium]|nr:DUF5683 domain-containing protein [Salinivirgaceae bacterium]